MLTSFSQLVENVKSKKRGTIAVAQAEDREVLLALERSRSMGLADGLLTGNPDNISGILNEAEIDPKNYELLSARNEWEAIKLARDSVKSGRAQVLMKGLNL